MSRWTAEFAQHPFQATWKALKEELVAIEIDDQTITTSVYELARLKRVVGYLDELIAGIDPEITPNGIWGSFHSQADAALQQVRAYVPSRERVSRILCKRREC